MDFPDAENVLMFSSPKKIDKRKKGSKKWVNKKSTTFSAKTKINGSHQKK